MIKVAIVDDDETVLEQARACIEGIDDLPEDVEISTFCGAEAFLSKIGPDDICQVLFTDIQMNGMGGIELGTIIQKRFPHIYLIFLTSFSHYAVDSYTVDAYQYILKQQMGERIPPVMRKLILKIQKERKKFRIIETVNGGNKIFYQDIICIKKVKGSKYVEYVTLYGIFRERITLEQLMLEMNSKEFIFAERGYIVNIGHIVQVKGNVINMVNGEQIVISRGRLADVRMKINEQWGEL